MKVASYEGRKLCRPQADMRGLFDTNIYVAHLLSPSTPSPINHILESDFMGTFTLLLPEELLTELREGIPRKDYLSERISPRQVEELIALLEAICELVPTMTLEIPAVTRDPKDDYLIAYALVGRADYMVTGDADLLVRRPLPSPLRYPQEPPPG